VEDGPSLDLFGEPAHPYTAGLLRSTPRLDVVMPRLTAIEGAPPDLLHPPTGCAFHPRCPLASDRCREEVPPLEAVGDQRAAACFKPYAINGLQGYQRDPARLTHSPGRSAPAVEHPAGV
jgi:oligopeptide/dipeptide ABC transporter ATP-binding protein